MAEEKKTTKKETVKKTTTEKTATKKVATKTATKTESKPKIDLTAAIKASASKKQEKPQEKKSLDEIIKHDNEEHKNDKPLDHNEVLRKKMAAQKKLNEEFENKDKASDIRAKLQALTSNEDIDTKEYEPIQIESNDQVKELEDQIEKLNNEVKDRDEQIMILTNSIVAKTNEAELLKEIEQLKLEITNLKEQKAEPVKAEEPAVNKVDIESEEIKAIINQGDILLRIKLLNERISEKDAQIKVVEDELNNLTEDDIVATAFATRVKIIRDDRRNIVDITNKKLVDLSNVIKSNEYRLNQKIVERNQKQAEIDAFNKEYEDKHLTYLEREDALNKRSKMQAELDGLNVSVDRIQEEFAHQVMIYKKIIKEAENFVESCNQQEDNLIQLYLKELRKERSAEKPDYESSIAERDSMLAELDKLNKIYEEMKAKNMLTDDEPVLSIDEINQMKKEYAKLVGKLQMIASRYAERSEVEDVLRTVDPEVSTYLNAFAEKEKLAFDNQEKMDIIATATPEMRDKINKIIDENRKRIVELDEISKKYEASEKVIFYKQLLNSMAELKEKEAIIKERAQKLKLDIERKDFSEE